MTDRKPIKTTPATKPIKTTPATDEEIEALLRENGVKSLDEIPPGSRVFHGWGEFFAGSVSDLLDLLEPTPERDRLQQQALASGREIEAAYEALGEGRSRALEEAFNAHMELVQEVVDELKAQEREGHG